MWTCGACDASIEDDAWDVCWRCSTPRALPPDEMQARRRLIQAKLGVSESLKCLRCSAGIEYIGTKRFHEGSRAMPFLLGNLGELLVHREEYDVYVCPQCGRIELFLDGINDAGRGESPV